MASEPTTDSATEINFPAIDARVRELAAGWAGQRAERQQRRELDPADFAALRGAGLLIACMPVARGGLWVDPVHSTRALADIFRTLGRVDSSLALVASMHHAVLSVGGWLADAEGPPPYRDAWEDEKRRVFQSVRDGAWWSTVISEPGSGGDTSKTQSVARRMPVEGQYRISGLKHFGSGTGIASYMITTAVPEGEDDRDTFVLDMRGVPLDGTAGVKLVAPWDGQGMIATQSHSLLFADYPAWRTSTSAKVRNVTEAPGGSPLWPAIITGIVDVAMETARAELGRRPSWRAFERVEWTRAESEAWLVEQAYEGMLRAVEQGDPRRALAKIAVAELAESTLQRLCRIVGGSTFGRRSPFGCWYEDVRALGFLRPPWGLAYDNLYADSWGDSTG